ncbi:MAG: ParA family protein [Saprospiraceae bacterium]|nr:ParA family protein [Saprospiraceae bacterium]
MDIDDQASIAELRDIDQSVYADLKPPFDVIKLEMNDLQTQIGELDKRYQLIFIDARGHLDLKADALQQEISRCMMYADLIFIPFVAGNFNFSANYTYLNFAKQVQSARQLTNRPLSIYAFINMYRTRSRANQNLVEELTSRKAELNLMQSYLPDYAAYREADTYTSLYEPENNDSAKQNFVAWLNEFLSIIQK